MEIEILKEKDTPLLSRKRISAMAYYEGPTPSRIKILTEVAKALKADVKLVSIRHIYTRFGSPRAKLIIHQYKDRASYERLEGKKLVAKHALPEKEEKAEEKPAEEAKPEAVKEEAKPEESAAKEEKPAEEAKPEEKKDEAAEAKKEEKADDKEAKPAEE